MNLILASKSPRRRELLGLFGLPFTIHAPGVDETMSPGLTAERAVEEISARKAAAVAALEPDALVIAADTIVVLHGVILGKPRDAAQATEMLQALQGRDHQVITGVTLRQGGKALTEAETTHVWFDPMSPAQIAAYVATGEPLDKAGAYGIQGLASMFIPRIDGDYFNVMGLPLCRLEHMLGSFGVSLLGGGV